MNSAFSPRLRVVLPVLFAAMLGCGGKGGLTTGVTAGASGGGSDGAAGAPSPIESTDDASSAGNSVADDATSGDVRTLVLLAFGGPAGKVAADVPLLEQPGPVGPVQNCDGPLHAGACQLTSCQQGGIASPSWGHGNFGPIAVSVGTTTVPLTYGGVGYGTVDFPASIALGEGGIMTFRGGNGGDVPAFDVSATIPGLAVLTSPAPATDAGSTIIDTSQDLSVTWVPISVGQVHFQLEATIPSASPETFVGEVDVTVTCTFDGGLGSGVIPQALLSSLKMMSGTSPTYASLSSEFDATTVLRRLTIVTQSYQYSPTGGGDIDVTLQ
jgi:hypothetical protein